MSRRHFYRKRTLPHLLEVTIESLHYSCMLHLRNLAQAALAYLLRLLTSVVKLLITREDCSQSKLHSVSLGIQHHLPKHVARTRPRQLHNFDIAKSHPLTVG